MNRADLPAILAAKRIRPRSYDLDGGNPEDRYCIEQSSAGWSVYYSERGHRNDERHFQDEDEACQELLRRLLADPTTRIRDLPPGLKMPRPAGGPQIDD